MIGAQTLTSLRQLPLVLVVGGKMALSSASVVEQNCYARALSPMVSMSILFGPGERHYSSVHSFLGGVIFGFLLAGMTFVAILGVFVRTTIDTWIQFSIYVVPLIALVSGFHIYTSAAFNKLLKRRLSRRSMLDGFVESDQEIPWHESQRPSWLRNAAIKNCVYPLALEVYQWTAYVTFHLVSNGDSFAGTLIESKSTVLKIDPVLWLLLYCLFWVMAMYITGFVAYSFILISRLTVRDVISFKCMFGDSPFLLYRPARRGNTVLKSSIIRPWRAAVKAVTGLTGFLFMDLFRSNRDIVLFYESDTASGLQESQGTPSPPDQRDVSLDADFWDPLISASVDVSGPSVGTLSVPERPKLKASEACMYLSKIIRNIEVLARLFQPFITLLAIFSVANVITHVGAFLSLPGAFKDVYSSHWWTFIRTCIWLLLSMRLLWSAAAITKALSSVSQHVNYLWATGKLQGEDGEWQKFFKLVEMFQLSSKTYGFPLTIRQVAALFTFINFALIISLSILKPSVHFPTTFSGN